jgi:hypothetical protein
MCAVGINVRSPGRPLYLLLTDKMSCRRSLDLKQVVCARCKVEAGAFRTSLGALIGKKFALYAHKSTYYALANALE